MNQYNKQKLKQELMILIEEWCKKCNRTYEEALDILKEMNTKKKDKIND